MAVERELELLRRVADLETKLDWLYRNTGHGSPYPQQRATVPVRSLQPEPASETVRQLARTGGRAAAVERYQQKTGTDLLTAARVVDGLR